MLVIFSFWCEHWDQGNNLDVLAMHSNNTSVFNNPENYEFL